MIKLNSMFSKFLTMLIVIFLINLVVFLSTGTTNANDNSLVQKNSSLIDENYRLKSKLKSLDKRLNDIETNLESINNYDNYIYSQIMGLNIDTTTDINDLSIYNNDSIFTNIDERSLYVSQLVSKKLTKFIETSKFIQKNKNVLNSYPTISPIKTGDFIEISSGFGWRIHPFLKKPLFHDGIDISALPETSIYSTMNGKVDMVLFSKYGYGNRVIIKNSYGFEILYAHLSENIRVKKGQNVKKGQLIATIGSTGLSTGLHLHYEIRQNNTLKDPLGYFFTYITNDLIASN